METITREILRLIGTLLLIFGGICGVSLYFRARAGSKEKSDGPGIRTLWALFLIALAVGLTLIIVTR